LRRIQLKSGFRQGLRAGRRRNDAISEAEL
jgi:hypothetical protein